MNPSLSVGLHQPHFRGLHLRTQEANAHRKQYSLSVYAPGHHDFTRADEVKLDGRVLGRAQSLDTLSNRIGQYEERLNNTLDPLDQMSALGELRNYLKAALTTGLSIKTADKTEMPVRQDRPHPDAGFNTKSVVERFIAHQNPFLSLVDKGVIDIVPDASGPKGSRKIIITAG